MKKVNKYYLQKVRELPCSACGVYGTQAHHNTNNTGLGGKTIDINTISLCPAHHHDLHFGIGVDKWQSKYGNQDDLVLKTRYIMFKDILENHVTPFKDADRLGFNLKDMEKFVRDFNGKLSKIKILEKTLLELEEKRQKIIHDLKNDPTSDLIEMHSEFKDWLKYIQEKGSKIYDEEEYKLISFLMLSYDSNKLIDQLMSINIEIQELHNKIYKEKTTNTIEN
jgi:hypothetical protein